MNAATVRYLLFNSASQLRVYKQSNSFSGAESLIKPRENRAHLNLPIMPGIFYSNQNRMCLGVSFI